MGGGYEPQWRDKTATAPAARETHRSGGPRIIKNKKQKQKNYFVGSFGLDFDVQTEGSIMDSRYDILECSNFANTYRQSQIIESQGADQLPTLLYEVDANIKQGNIHPLGVDRRVTVLQKHLTCYRTVHSTSDLNEFKTTKHAETGRVFNKTGNVRIM
jgi:hypothetical protein